METRGKIVGSVFAAILFVDGLWQVFSAEPLAVGVLRMLGVNSGTALLDFIMRYWTFLFSVAILLVLWGPGLWFRMRGFNVIIAKRFVDQIVVVDGNHYIDCTFENCRMRWNGGYWLFQNLKRINTTFETQNITVTNTINILKSFGWLEKSFANSWQMKPKEYFKGDFVDAHKQATPKNKAARKTKGGKPC